MKLKNSVRSITPVTMFIVLACAVLICVPLRTFQLVAITDPKTGFFLTRDVTVIILAAVAAVAGIAEFVLCRLGSKFPEPSFPSGKNRNLSVSALLFSLLLFVDTVMNGFVLAKLVMAHSTDTSLRYFLMSSGVLFLGISMLFELISVIYFAQISNSYSSGKHTFEKHRAAALSPVIWCMFRMIYRFSKPISYKNVGQLFIEVVLLVMLMGFFMSFARIASGVNPESSVPVFYASGTVSVMLAAISSIPVLIMLMTGRAELIPADYPLSYSSVGIVIFVTCLMSEMLPRTKAVPKEKKEKSSGKPEESR